MASGLADRARTPEQDDTANRAAACPLPDCAARGTRRSGTSAVLPDRLRGERPDVPERRPTGAALRFGYVEAEIEDRRAVRDPAGRDQIDPGGGDFRRGVARDAARGLGNGAAGDHRDRAAQGRRGPVVGEYRLDALAAITVESPRGAFER